MSTYKLQDSPEKQMLMSYLNDQIQKCNDRIIQWAGVAGLELERGKHFAKKEVYEEILEMIR